MWTLLEDDKEELFSNYQYVLVVLIEIRNLRDQIAGLDAAEVFLPSGETKVRGLLQEMRKKADARLKSLNDIYAKYRDKLNESLDTVDRSEANLEALERNVEDLNRKVNAAGCVLPPPGNLISSLPPPSALGAPLPPVRTPTTQVPGSVTRVPPRRPTPGAMRLQFVGVTSDPPQAQPSGDWTWDSKGGQITQEHVYSQSPRVAYRVEYEWTEPAIGPEGVSTTLTLTVRPHPGNDIYAVIGVNPGDFESDPPNPSLDVQARNGQTATRSQTVTLKLPKGYSGTDIYLRIGAGYGPVTFVYHYRVVR